MGKELVSCADYPEGIGLGMHKCSWDRKWTMTNQFIAIDDGISTQQRQGCLCVPWKIWAYLALALSQMATLRITSYAW